MTETSPVLAAMLDASAAFHAHAAARRGRIDSFDRRHAAANAPCSVCGARGNLMPQATVCKPCFAAGARPAYRISRKQGAFDQAMADDADRVAAWLAEHDGAYTAHYLAGALAMTDNRMRALMARLANEAPPRAQIHEPLRVHQPRRYSRPAKD